MKLIKCITLFVIILAQDIFGDVDLSKFYQHDYKIRNTRIELITYNKDLIHFLEVKTFKYNRTTTAFNVTFVPKVNMSHEVDVVVQAYKFLSNEYRLFPARARVNGCKILLANIGGMISNYKCGNIKIKKCFFQQGINYHVCNFNTDQSRFPPFIPTGEFKAAAELFYLNYSLGKADAYGEVYRPIPYPKRKIK